MKPHRRVTPEEVMLAVGALEYSSDQDLIDEIKCIEENLQGLREAKIVSLRTSNEVVQTRILLERVIHYRRTGSAEG